MHKHKTRVEGWHVADPALISQTSIPLSLALLFQAALVLGLWLCQRTRAQLMHDLAYRDALTGLANRRALERDLARCLRRPTQPLLALIDIDGLKAVNDTQGHAIGDDLLRRFAAGLAQQVAGRGQAYRLSGDEFAVIMNREEPEGMEQIVVGVTRRVQQMYLEAGASVGTARRRRGESVSAWLARADRAMYGDKRRKRIRQT